MGREGERGKPASLQLKETAPATVEIRIYADDGERIPGKAATIVYDQDPVPKWSVGKDLWRRNLRAVLGWRGNSRAVTGLYYLQAA